VGAAGGGGGAGGLLAGIANNLSTGVAYSITIGAGAASVGSGNGTSGAGGSGVVILRVLSTNSATFSGGLTSSLSTSVTGYKTYTVTAGTGTVTFS
jgi:hypothetical protein